MANIFFSGRIPEALSEHVEEYAKALGKSKTRILIEALAQYTGYGSTTGVKNKRSVPLSEFVEQLQQQIEKHQEKLNRHEQDLELIKNQLIDGAKPKVFQTDNNVISSSKRSLPKHNREEIKAEGASDDAPSPGANENKNISQTVCLSESAWNKLKEIAEQRGVSQTDVIERLLAQNYKDVDEVIKILNGVINTKKKTISSIIDQVKFALSYLSETPSLKKFQKKF